MGVVKTRNASADRLVFRLRHADPHRSPNLDKAKELLGGGTMESQAPMRMGLRPDVSFVESVSRQELDPVGHGISHIVPARSGRTPASALRWDHAPPVHPKSIGARSLSLELLLHSKGSGRRRMSGFPHVGSRSPDDLSAVEDVDRLASQRNLHNSIRRNGATGHAPPGNSPAAHPTRWLPAASASREGNQSSNEEKSGYDPPPPSFRRKMRHPIGVGGHCGSAFAKAGRLSQDSIPEFAGKAVGWSGASCSGGPEARGGGGN